MSVNSVVVACIKVGNLSSFLVRLSLVMVALTASMTDGQTPTPTTKETFVADGFGLFNDHLARVGLPKTIMAL